MFSLLKDNTSAEIKCNKVTPTLQTLKQYSSVPHGFSLLALFLIDKNNKGLEMSLGYSSDVSLNNVVDTLFSVWLKFEPIKSFIRSFKKDNVFLQEIDGIKLLHTNDRPQSEDEFDNKHVIIDVELVDLSYDITIYRWGEPTPRKLKLQYKTA